MATKKDTQRRIKSLNATAAHGSGATDAERQTAKRLVKKLEEGLNTLPLSKQVLPRTALKEEIPEHRILREVLRHYMEYKALVLEDGRNHIIDHGYYVEKPDGGLRKVSVSISFWDLQDALKELAPRKREAIFWNVIMDQKQKDVAKRMGITTVSVGQYVEAACLQLAKRYFGENTPIESVAGELEAG